MSRGGKIIYYPGKRPRWTRVRSRPKFRKPPRRRPAGLWIIGLACLAAFALGWTQSGPTTVWNDILRPALVSVSGDLPGYVKVIRPSDADPISGPRVITLSPRSSEVNEASVTGRASVVDGDTIDIHGERVRLNGIDAPESDQSCEDGRGRSYRCGAESADQLDSILAASRPTRCEFVDRDAYGRMVADCYRADGQNVAALLVSSGHALDWPRYSRGAYAAEQRKAQTAKRGLWRGTFVEPWEWRQGRRQHVEQVQAPVKLLQPIRSPSGCRIKGNISDSGERIYHVPGQRYYERTKISPQKGERWFCSEAEARSAGWRRSKV